MYRKSFVQRAAVLFLAVLLFAGVWTSVPCDGKEPDARKAIDAKMLAVLVQSADKIEKQEFSWGWIQWLMNSKIDRKAEMTFGIVQLNAGQTNPLHVHANCEEQLYVLSGSCDHRIGDKSVVLKAGDVIRIPRGVPHKATTSKKEPMRAIIVYSSADRQFEVVEE